MSGGAPGRGFIYRPSRVVIVSRLPPKNEMTGSKRPWGVTPSLLLDDQATAIPGPLLGGDGVTDSRRYEPGIPLDVASSLNIRDPADFKGVFLFPVDIDGLGPGAGRAGGRCRPGDGAGPFKQDGGPPTSSAERGHITPVDQQLYLGK